AQGPGPPLPPPTPAPRNVMGHPRLRTEHQPSIRPDSQIQIGALPNLASILPDPGGWRWNLLQLLDGTRNTADVLQTMKTAHPDVPAAHIGRLLTDLARAGHLHDSVTSSPPADMAPDTVQRRLRNAEYLEMVDRRPDRTGWDIQAALARAVVTIVGIGGTGSVAAAALAAAGIGRLVLVDHDQVEESNLNRQILYTASDIGRPKIDAAWDRLKERHPDLDVVTIPEQITLRAQFARLMRGCDLLILAADQPDGLRLTANRAAIESGCAWVDPGYHGPVISTTLYVPADGRGCWECLRHADAVAHGLPGIRANVPPAALPRTTGHPVTAVTAGLAGTWAAHAAITHLTGTREFTPATVYRHSLIAPADQPLAPLTYPRNPHCPSCTTS
ncbi:HesA/MoeB/ThiF family protein, partial [Kitasatospora sp. NPDC057542]|uniref:HesA/MoeB/ThiF family protein n=1 Tax=Kitasatospora sp. NPDC057542 TaxID=3346162 RepID=UPI003676556C